MNFVLLRVALLLPATALLFCASAAAQTPAARNPPAGPSLTLSTEAVAPSRFVAAHGQRALLMGYSGMGLEAWAYPFQLFSDYRVQFLPQGEDAAIDADTLLRRIDYSPDGIVRTYVGPDFVVREHLFVPLDQPGVILSYDVEGRRALDLRVTFLPALELMWPAGLGGQELHWNDDLHGLVTSERTTATRAVMASPQLAAHSELVNATLRTSLAQSMVLHPENGHAAFFAALEDGSAAEGSVVRLLEQQEPQLRAAAHDHIQAVVHRGIRIVTPDAELNRALAWSRLALDQAWVCNDKIGCGFVAGYGPSRGMRRPQYAWFFAGDGLVATEALLATGDFARARDELAFILQYQNRSNGMIWHEISQSAGHIDWAGKYPYLYVHVDITFDFLTTLANYYTATGDLDFLRAHWEQIAAAYGFCRSIVSPQTGLPEIPAGKEGGNEQDRMREDVGLSAAWADASTAYQQLALATAHTAEAGAAADAAIKARGTLTARYWDPKSAFWIAGYSENGAVMTDQRSHPDLLGRGLLTPAQEDAALDRLASADFETDWGARGMSAQSSGYDPNSYGAGSVSALLTADMAEAFWRDGRPAVALPIWQSLLPWLQFDSLGHMHELFSGDFCHPQVESVPEQTWSSAGFLHATLRGLFGIEVDAPGNRLILSPHLDPRWPEVTLANIPVGAASVTAVIDQHPGEIDATFTASGGAPQIVFAPEIPLGATALRAQVDGRIAPVSQAEDEQARATLDLAQQPVHLRILYSGGVRVVAPAAHPAIGEPSRQIKLISATLNGNRLTLEADVATEASLEIDTPWKIASIEGGTNTPLGNSSYRLTFTGIPDGLQYVRRRITLDFDRRASR